MSHPAVIAVNQLVYAELAQRGWHVDLVVPDRWTHEYSGTDCAQATLAAFRESIQRIPILFPGRPQRHVYTVNPRRIIRRCRPDVIFVEQEPSSLAALQWGVAASSLGIPFGVQMDENRDRNFPAPVRRARAWVLTHAAFVATRSPTAGRLVDRLGARGEIHLVPHHVPGWAALPHSPGDRFRVGFAGRLVPEKGLDVLVKAIRCLDGGPVELVVAGDGPLREWLASQDLRGSSLRLMTEVSHDAMDVAYAEMDVLVLPSRATPTWVEQFGRVLVEALWCGVPVVGSDTGEIPWVIGDTGGGIVFPDGDSFALAQVLDHLRIDCDARAGFARRGKQRSRELFSVEAVASELGPLLERATISVATATHSSDTRPRVALVAHGIHDRGGMERACAELIRNTYKEVRFVVVTTDLAPDLVPLIERWARIRIPRRPIPLKFVLFFCLGAIAVRRAQADLIHTVGAIVPNRANVAAVHHCHAGARQALGGFAPVEAPRVRRLNTTVARTLAMLAERWCYRPDRLQRLAPVSSGVAAEIRLHYPDIPVVVVANGVDVGQFHPDSEARRRGRAPDGLSDADLVALFVGGDWNHKGLAVALEALALARSEGAPVWLWVVGSGDHRRFEQLAIALGVISWVRFFGFCPDPAPYYQAADVFVLPSLYETFSLVCYEAAACGLPIVATAVSGVSELVGLDEGGIVVTRDPATIFRALVTLSESIDTRRRLGAEAKRRAASYTWAESARTELRLYQALLGAAPPDHEAA